MFSGSLSCAAPAWREVIATGARSEIGKIGEALARIETEPPRLQAQTRRLVARFAVVGMRFSSRRAAVRASCAANGWMPCWRGIALGMSMLPEEFPLVLTVFMAMGAWRISHARVLTRRTAAIETLGAATVLCTDKTGTLTQNRMTMQSCGCGRRSMAAAAARPDAGPFPPRYSIPACSPARRAVRPDGEGVPRARREWLTSRTPPSGRSLVHGNMGCAPICLR